MNTLKTLLIFVLIAISSFSFVQEWKTDKNMNVLFGLTPALFVDGFNMEVNYIHNQFLFDCSQGVTLEFSGSTATKELERQGVTVHTPWTTGFGVGYRLNQWLNVRVESKWHKFEFYYEGVPKTSKNKIDSFHTFSLGLGLYANFQPFKKSTTFLKGVMVATSIGF
jgi:hypothetical protein